MPELSFHTNVCKELIKGNWSDMENEQKAARMAFSGTRSLLLWCRQQTEGYSEVNVFNMSTSWRDGLAFCAIIHRYRPDLIDFDRLSKENILENNELAFSMAEKHFGIPMVLDASDMIEHAIPDKLSVITYVSQLYEYFKNKTPANQGYSTKMNIQPKARSESTGHKGSKRTSPSHQIYLLSGHAKRVATALRNVFKSDTKEESSKGKEQVHSHGKYLSVDAWRTSLETNRTSEELSPSLARKSPFLGNDCFVCQSRVFLMERLVAERKLFHRACFRCDKCSACLRPGTYHYFPDTEKFCCLFDCTGVSRKQPIKIKLEPLTDVSQESHKQSLSPESSPNLSDKNSTNPPEQEHDKSPLQRQFSVVKRNAITLPALSQALNQKKSNTVKGPKHSHATKSEGEKKRRFSGGRRVKNKLGGKGKGVNSGGPSEQEKTSWSPVNKRRAPGTRSADKSDSVENKNGDATNCTFNTDGPSTIPLTSSSPKFDLLSNKEQAEEKKILAKPFELKKHDEDRTTKEASPNLFFSFKEELLKRATESKGAEGGKLLNSCEHVLPEMSNDKDKKILDNDGRREGNSSENDLDSCESDLKEENLANSDKRKCSEDSSSVNSDSTKSVGSHKASVSDEVEPLVAPKSVQKLREKFLNINDMIEVKHKNNLAKKSFEVQRELRCISAWKQQTDSHAATTRKFSGNGAGKELKKPNLGVSRRSVKELRKMYMAGGSGESKAARGKSNVVRSKSFQSSMSIERKANRPKTTGITTGGAEEKCDSTGPKTEDNSASCKDVDDNYSSARDIDNSCQSIHAENSSQSQDADNNSSLSRDVDCVTGDEEGTTNDRKVPFDVTEHIAVINIDSYNHGKAEGNVAADSQSRLSSEKLGSMSHETKAYTVIKSSGVSNEVPSLQIEPASPESLNGERRSPGLKRHAASHDSGIDMPSYTQNNLLSSVPDGKIPAGNLKVAAEFSFPGSGASVLTPSEQLLNETGRDLQISNHPSSPRSDYSPEVFWSLPLSTGDRTSLTDTSSSCSSPRMSVIIAQESSTTKINSRFFTVETMEPWDFEDHRIAEEHQCVMEVEGEFCFGREKSRTSRAEREAIFSLRSDSKSGSFNSADLIKEEEITLSPSEIDSELQTLEALHRDLERRGVEIEHSLRESMNSERPFNDCEDDLLREWLSVVHERNVILRRESELIYLLQSHNYEERYRTVEGELRKLVAMRDEVKSSDDLKRERELLSELLELVQKRSFIVDSLEEERVREIHEDDKVEQALTDGIAALPENCWEQRQDCTKVAFSRFYC